MQMAQILLLEISFLFKLCIKSSSWSSTNSCSHMTEFHLLLRKATCLNMFSLQQITALPLTPECEIVTCHFLAESQTFQESPYARNHTSKTLYSGLLHNQSQLGQIHDECPMYQMWYVISCNVKLALDYVLLWQNKHFMVIIKLHQCQSVWRDMMV
jgi:hypothetical protein